MFPGAWAPGVPVDDAARHQVRRAEWRNRRHRLPAPGWGPRGQAGDVSGGYPLAPHTGQAPMPWLASTRWATEICCDCQAPAAVEEYRPPPLASQVPSENWSPP